MNTLGHLGAEEFVNLADGFELDRKRGRHLENCAECRATLASITRLQRDIAEPEQMDSALADVDWAALRSSVRDRLLSRSIKRSSRVQRWTGRALSPALAWGLAVLVLVSGMTLGGLWHHQTAHPGTETARDVLSLADVSGDIADSPAVSAEALGWTETEIFASLNELQAGEEEALRELISLAFTEDSFFEGEVLQ